MKSWFKCKRGDGKEGRLSPSETTCHSANIPRQHSLSIKTLQKTPFLNPDPLTHWNMPESIAQVRIDNESCWALLDNGSTINAVTPEFVEACSLDIGPLSNLVDGRMGINGFGGLFSQPWGYLIKRVQVEGLWGHEKDQVALFIPDSTIIGSQGAVYSRHMLTINWIINMIK